MRRFSEVIDASFVKIEMNFRVAAIGIDDTNQALFNVAIVWQIEVDNGDVLLEFIRENETRGEENNVLLYAAAFQHGNGIAN
ncbi:Uncharacterised protein [Mitsuokella jalaludinii]|uniref:Uncharacterized protein n=1 Tax=Mitsuokella jalaludinii TaxID=187979 RepID=A0A173ZJB9_9FIRM|nr:Uncharacterised protein [Mitsuokella jalaludinii]